MDSSLERVDSSINGLDLVNPVANIRPHMKMRTLNWRRIPKRQVLSKVAALAAATAAGSSAKQQALSSRRQTIGHVDETPTCNRNNSFRASIGLSSSDDERTASDDDDDDDDDDDTEPDGNGQPAGSGTINVWFLIAKANKTVKLAPLPSDLERRQGQSGQQDDDTIEDNDKTPQLQGPVTSTSSKSASRIREMLESVRRRMAAVSAIGGDGGGDGDSSQCQEPSKGEPNQAHHQSMSDLSSASLLSGGSRRSSRLPLRSALRCKPGSVLEAVDFHHLESLFCLNNQPLDEDPGSAFVRRSSLRTNASSDSVISSMNSYDSNQLLSEGDRDGDDSSAGHDDSLEWLSQNILDSKKSLNVNIFLKQLKSQADFLRLVDTCEHSQLGSDKLESLLKLLPDDHEQVQLLKFHSRNKQHRLPVAERFLLQLATQVPNLRLKIKFMLLKEKYSADVERHIAEQLDKLEAAVREICRSKKLRDLLNLVLVTGNFLNSGGYAADAVGFALDCLERLNEVRSNQEGIYLIHYVAEVAHRMGLLDFQQSELARLESASRVCLETIKLDLATMLERIAELLEEIDKAPSQLQTQGSAAITPMKSRRGQGGQTARQQASRPPAESAPVEQREFLAGLLRTLAAIKSHVELLRRRLTVELELTRCRLADYLCEDPNTFNLHDCFRTILSFGQRLRAAAEENERRQRAELARANTNTTTTNNHKPAPPARGLKRSNTINARLPRTSNSCAADRDRKSFGCVTGQPQVHLLPRDKTRASFGGYISSADKRAHRQQQQQQQQVACLGRQLGELPLGRQPAGGASHLRRSSSNCSNFIKSSLSSLSSLATTNSTAASSMNNSGEGDELHDGLMRLLNDSNYRRYSDISRGGGGGSSTSSTSLATAPATGATSAKARGPFVSHRRRLFNH